MRLGKGPTKFMLQGVAREDANAQLRARHDQTIAVLEDLEPAHGTGPRFLVVFPDGLEILAYEGEVVDTGSRHATNVRLRLPAHPTARHGFAKPNDVTDEEFYDEMPMLECGEIYEPTLNPRHRATEGAS